MALRSLPAVYMRGGTSRALFFDRDVLPPLNGDDTSAWDTIFCAALGSPDPNGRQLNGMGGGITSLSKIAIIGSSSHPAADLDYTFAQVQVKSATVGYRGNCGNISSAVGPYAIDRGLVKCAGDQASITIHNTNTGKLLRATFALEDGLPKVSGDFTIDGVGGSGAPIALAFLEPAGAATGRLFPSGNRRDILDLPGVGAVEASLVDAGNPVVFLKAAAFGLQGIETVDRLTSDGALLANLEHARAAGAVAMGMIAHPDEARTRLRNLPLVSLLSAPTENDDAHIRTFMFSSGQPHKASPLTAGICLAAAAVIPDTLPQALARSIHPNEATRIRHVAGVLDVAVRGCFDGPDPEIAEAIVYRTARKLMEGLVFF